MKASEKIRTHLRASWRRALWVMLRLTYRAQDGIEARLKKA